MNRSSGWNIKNKIGKIMLGLVLAAMFGSMDVTPASADDHRGRREYRDNDRYEHRGRGYERDRRHVRHRRGYRTTTVYRERVYVEPPVVYAPPSPPGISIFFPPIIFRP